MGTPIIIAKKTADPQQEIALHSQFANRHGLITGATGTGKTVTLQEGVDGLEDVTYEITMIDGEVTDRQAVSYNRPPFAIGSHRNKNR
jgi:type II secretory ATPase GspE/PulE/Tfp pilus assembly ATPase PilB-like protein